MRLEPLLRAHAFMRVEQPPRLWEVDVDDEPLICLLGELIVAGLARGTELADLVLNVNNVTVAPDDHEDGPPAGDFVALTIRGGGDWAPETTWRPGERPGGALTGLRDRLLAAGCPFAYTRAQEGGGSVTAFLPRLFEVASSG